MPQLKVLHVNTISTGGAAIAAIRLHLLLLEEGIDSNILFLYRSKYKKDIPNAYYLEDNYKYKIYFKFLVKINIIFNRLFTFYKPKVYFNGVNSVFNISKHPIFQKADIIHLHWVVKFLNWNEVFSKNKQYVWTMHDMNPFTGGEHYKTGYNNDFKWIGNINKRKKEKILKEISIKFVSPSQWLKNEALKSSVLSNFDIEVIRNPIPSLYNANVKQVRTNNQKKLLFVAENPTDVRKGLGKLIKILNELPFKEVFKLVIIGNKIENLKIELDHEYLGFINDDSELARIYGSCDYFIIPSIEDNLPNTVSESLLCGTPVIGFQIGGIPEMVVNNENGFLAKTDEQLAEILNSLKEQKTILQFDPKKYLDSDKEVIKYINLYKHLLSK